jgi:CRP/FNR family cyclic AMP-dependent transcriptional regulator
MKGILNLLRHFTLPPQEDEKHDSSLFTTAFGDLAATVNPTVTWDSRALDVGAVKLNASHGIQLLQGLWSRDKYMRQLDADAIRGMERFFTFATVPPKRDLIRQDEYGNFMLVLLSGAIAIHRTQPWGESLRLAEAVPGEMLGEMSLLDSGIRFSVCTTVNDCEIAILSTEALDAMLSAQPALAANLIALLARKLSLRLRVVSARLSNKK